MRFYIETWEWAVSEELTLRLIIPATINEEAKLDLLINGRLTTDFDLERAALDVTTLFQNEAEERRICADGFCLNYGECLSGDKNYGPTCTCEAGFVGSNC